MSDFPPAHLPPVYVLGYYHPDLAEVVQEQLPGVEVIKVPVLTKTVSKEDILMIQENAEIVYSEAMLVHHFMHGCKNLKWIQAKNAGVESVLRHIDLKKPLSFRLTRTPVNSLYIGEYVIMYILAIERGLLDMYDCQTRHQWKQMERRCGRVMASLTICVLGVGAVGTEVARRCKQFGMKVVGVGRTSPADRTIPPHFDEYTNNIEDVLSRSDYLCSTLPSTSETRGLLSGKLLSGCQKNKTTFISVGRGDVIDEETIAQAIREGWFRAAVLDVCPVEPLPENSILWNLRDVIITPHISGSNASRETMHQYVTKFVANYHRYCSGQPLDDEMDFNKGY